jgi:hypothetical protein
MIPKEDADTMRPFMAGKVQSNMIIPVSNTGDRKEYKLIIPELW